MENNLKEHRMLKFALETAVCGDPQSVVDNIDNYCRHKEWAMNVGDEKGFGAGRVHCKHHSSVKAKV